MCQDGRPQLVTCALGGRGCGDGEGKGVGSRVEGGGIEGVGVVRMEEGWDRFEDSGWG